MNSLLKITDSPLELSLFRYLKFVIDCKIKRISANSYKDGNLFIMGQLFREIKGNSYLLRTGVNIGEILNPEKSVVFYFLEKQTNSKSHLIDIKDVLNLKQNIDKAIKKDIEIAWQDIKENLIETYPLKPHNEQELLFTGYNSGDSKAVRKGLAQDKKEPKYILVVDDEYQYFKYELVTAVSRNNENWKLRWAKDKERAMMFLRGSQPIDLVLLDIELTRGKAEGKEILAWLRKNQKQNGEDDSLIPVIVFSKHTNLKYVKEMISKWELAADDYLPKLEVLEKNNYNHLLDLIETLFFHYSTVHEMHKILAPEVHYNSSRFEIYGKSIPFTDVGGDVVDIVEENNKLTIYLADASGHGKTAGLLAGMFKSSLTTMLFQGSTLKDSINTVNSVLFNIKTKSNKYLTAAALQFSSENYAIFFNAAHPAILKFENKNDKIMPLSANLQPIGFLEQFNDNNEDQIIYDVSFAIGDIFVLYSDGITETKRDNEEFEVESLIEIIKQNRNKPLVEIFSQVITNVRKFGRQMDDQTLLLVRVK